MAQDTTRIMDKLDALRLAEDTRDIGHAIKLLQGVDQKLVASDIRIGRIVRALKEIKSNGTRKIAKQFLNETTPGRSN